MFKAIKIAFFTAILSLSYQVQAVEITNSDSVDNIEVDDLAEFVNKNKTHLDNWSKKNADGSYKVSDDNVSRIKSELCEILNKTTCQMSLTTAHGSALIADKYIVIRDQPDKKIGKILNVNDSEVHNFNFLEVVSFKKDGDESKRITLFMTYKGSYKTYVFEKGKEPEQLTENRPRNSDPSTYYNSEGVKFRFDRMKSKLIKESDGSTYTIDAGD